MIIKKLKEVVSGCFSYCIDVPYVIMALSESDEGYSRKGGCHGHDRMVVGFATTCAISAYHH